MAKLAATALLIHCAGRINPEVVDIGLSVLIDQPQRHCAVRSPERLLRSRTIVESAGVLFVWLDAEDFETKEKDRL